MRKEDVLRLPSMPAAGPSYPAGPYRFIDREFLVITYETDPDLIREGLPEPLEPIDQPIVHYEWIKMPDSSERNRLYREMAKIIENYAPWRLDISRYRNMLAQPWVLGYKKHPILHAEWQYIDIAAGPR